MSADAALEVQVTFDCADPEALCGFWRVALGYRLAPPPAGFGSWEAALDAWGVPPEARNERSAAVDPAGRGPRLFFQRVPEGKQAKNRVHLDVRAAPGLSGEEREDALERKARELVEVGAVVVRRLGPSPVDELCVVMQDPEGNEFCLD